MNTITEYKTISFRVDELTYNALHTQRSGTCHYPLISASVQTINQTRRKQTLSYTEQLHRVKEQKRLHDSYKSRWQGDPDSPYLKVEQAHRRILSDYYDREIERLTDLAIQEQVMKRLNEIDYNVTINGEKLTDAIIEQFNKGFRK